MLLIITIGLINAVFGSIDFFTPYGMAKTFTVDAANMGGGSGSHIIYRQAGGVMKGPVNVYHVYYGSNWPADVRYKIENFVKYMDQSSYFSIIKNYYDQVGNVTGPLIMKESIWMKYEYGNELTLKSLVTILLKLYPKTDPNGIYVLLTDNGSKLHVASNVKFCEQYCGFHTIYEGRKIAYVGDASVCRSCSPFNDHPNLDKSSDPTINILAHEIVETLSNPDTTNPSYKTNNNEENADVCNFHMGSSNPRDNRGNRYNVIIGNLKYYVQNYWSLIKNGCALSE